MKKLMEQFMKFGLVGGVSFGIDYGVYTVLLFMNVHYMLAALAGFLVSLVANYVLSMKFVFVRRDDIGRKREFTVFLLLSVCGLVLSEMLIWTCYDVIYLNMESLMSMMRDKTAQLVGKLIATFIVMFFNFISRKIFLEKKE